jgi:hypothetical protein
MRAFLITTVGLISFLFCDSARAGALLSLDFQQNGDTVQSGFTQFAGPITQSAPYSLTFGAFTVTVTAQVDGQDLGGGFFDRSQTGGPFTPPLTNSGAFTYANLYNSFAYNNSSNTNASTAATSLTVSISGAGITALTPYSLTFFSFDSDSGRPSTTGTHTVSFTGLSGTTGSSSNIIWSDTARPTTNNQDSTTGIYTSNGSGTLTFLVSDTYVGNTDSRSGVRLNALILDTLAPEPGTLGMIALAIAGAAVFSRRRRLY